MTPANWIKATGMTPVRPERVDNAVRLVIPNLVAGEGRWHIRDELAAAVHDAHHGPAMQRRRTA
jgi:hypothetical protein